jgi:hypothetical protein
MPAPQVFQPGDPVEAELRAAAAEAVEREEMLGDAAVLGDPAIQGLTWRVWKLSNAGETLQLGHRGQGIYWCSMTGPLDLEYLRAVLGGGTFRFVGRGETPTGERVAETHVQTFVGPNKQPPPPVPQPNMAAAEPASNGHGDPSLAAVVAELRELRKELQHPPQPPVDPFAMVERIAALMSTLRPEAGAPQSAEKILEFGLGMMERGMKIGEQREPGEETMLETITKLAPLAKDVLQVLKPAPRPVTFARPVAPGTTSPGSPAPASTPGPSEPEVTQVNPHRVAALVDTVARAIERGTPPPQMAYTAEDMLDDNELQWLHQQDGDGLTAILVQHFKAYPVFGTDAGKSYVNKFLLALRADEGEREAQLGADVADTEGDLEPSGDEPTE